jgi:hypothetical protein
MPIGKYIKAPVDRKRYLIDYSEWLDTSEAVGSVVFAVDPVSAQHPLVVDGIGIVPAATGVQYYASGGVAGVDYKVFITMTTVPGQVREDVIIFSVRNP